MKMKLYAPEIIRYDISAFQISNTKFKFLNL